MSANVNTVYNCNQDGPKHFKIDDYEAKFNERRTIWLRRLWVNKTGVV